LGGESRLESKNASSMLALRKRCAILPNTYFIAIVTFCQEEGWSGVFRWEGGAAGVAVMLGKKRG
jgi:hypothetical protein